jgi:hypothetical protein
LSDIARGNGRQIESRIRSGSGRLSHFRPLDRLTA